MIDDEEYGNEGGAFSRAPGKRVLTRTQPKRTEPESHITERLLSWLNAQPRTFARKRFSSVQGTTGHPDIEGCSRGRSIQIEVKRPGQRPTKLQLARMRVWQEAGALVAWVCSLEQLETVLARLDDPGWRNPLTEPGDGASR